MTKKERDASKRFQSKEWKDAFINWLLPKVPYVNTNEIQSSWAHVVVPTEKDPYYFDIVLTKETDSSKIFSSVSISELLFAITHTNHQFVVITKGKNEEYKVLAAYTYSDIIPMLDISPFVFKFHFSIQKLPPVKINPENVKYSQYPKKAVKLNGEYLIALLNLYGDYKTNNNQSL